MENLKKAIIAVILLVTFTTPMAQSQAALQNAFTKSYEYEKAGNYSASIAQVKSVYKTDSYIDNIRLGWLNYLAKQYSESIKYYEKSIALKPYAIEAKFGCIKPLSAIENWEKVKQNYLQILKIDPQNTLANYWLGVIYYNKRDYVNASKLFEKVVNLYPLDYDSIIMLAWSKLSLGKQIDAKVLFNQALIIRPNDSSALTGLSKLK